jgi:hypothetical protein
VTTIAGDVVGNENGVGTSARFYRLLAIALSPDDSFAVAVDKSNCLIKKLDMSTMQVPHVFLVPTLI